MVTRIISILILKPRFPVIKNGSLPEHAGAAIYPYGILPQRICLQDIVEPPALTNPLYGELTVNFWSPFGELAPCLALLHRYPV